MQVAINNVAIIFLNFMGCTKSVKKMNERNAGFYGGQMGHQRQIHNFLNRGCGQHGKSGLANRAQVAAYFLEDLYDLAGARPDETGAPRTPMN